MGTARRRKNIEVQIFKRRESNFKWTKIRRAIFDIFSKNPTPLSIQELQKKLRQAGMKPNKTTLYRDTATMADMNMILPIEFGDGKTRYEIKTEHHHHLVCQKCHKVAEVRLGNDLAHEEKIIGRKFNFRVLDHSLEFFGLCARCSR